MAKKQGLYKGELAKHIVIPKPPSMPTILTQSKDYEKSYKLNLEVYYKKVVGQVLMSRTKKIGLLMEHYGIDAKKADKWFYLANALADEHVEGFKVSVKGSVGRPTEWNPITLAKLYFDVEDKLREKKGGDGTVAWACRQLARSSPWKQENTQSEKRSSTLRNQYIFAKENPYVTVYNKIERETGMTQFYDEYKEMINKVYEDVKKCHEN